MFASGRRTLDIADLKLAEANNAIGADPVSEVWKMFDRMQIMKSMRNLRLGIGHQSRNESGDLTLIFLRASEDDAPHSSRIEKPPQSKISHKKITVDGIS